MINHAAQRLILNAHRAGYWYQKWMKHLSCFRTVHKSINLICSRLTYLLPGFSPPAEIFCRMFGVEPSVRRIFKQNVFVFTFLVVYSLNHVTFLFEQVKVKSFVQWPKCGNLAAVRWEPATYRRQVQSSNHKLTTANTACDIKNVSITSVCVCPGGWRTELVIVRLLVWFPEVP